MKTFAFITQPRYSPAIARYLGDDWQSRYELVETFEAEKTAFTRNRQGFKQTDADTFVLLRETAVGLTQGYILDSKTAYEAKVRPMQFTYMFRDEIKHHPTEPELKVQIEAVLELWQKKLGINLDRSFKFYNAPTREHLRVRFDGWYIKPKPDGNPRLWIKFLNTGDSRNIQYPISCFNGEFRDIIPTQAPCEQPGLFG